MEYFVLPYRGLFVLYAPLKKLAFLVNGAVVDALKRRTVAPQPLDLSHDCKQILEFLDATGIFDATFPIASESSFSFKPTSVTLFLTTACNLRCIYCYASAGERSPVTMPWNIAKAAIDFIVKNALETGVQSVELGFHGGGEPTLAWALMKRIVAYFRRIATSNGLIPSVYAASNGVIPQKRLAWIIENLTSVNISLDGLAAIQNSQRPTVHGENSFDAVWSTIRAMDMHKFNYGIRATVTKNSVSEMAPFTAHVAAHSACKQLHFEPTFSCGRCATANIDGPSSEEFITGFRTAYAAAKGSSLELMYSGASLYTVTDKFCQGAGESFCLTPTGNITSCYEVNSSSDPRAQTFFYGKYNHKNGEFIVFPEKLQYLQQRTVTKIEHCNNCFCKYHCAGDCLTRATDGLHLSVIKDSSRCAINQALTLDQIAKKLSTEP